MIEFGKSLRLAREAKGYTVAQLADITRLAPKTVQELESENFSHIAAPIYGRGFVKLYCEAVGLEAKPFVEEFMDIYNGVHDVSIKERNVRPAEPPPPPKPAPEPPPADKTEPEPVTAPEPPPLILDSPRLSAATRMEPASTQPPASEPQPSAPLSRYAAPVRPESAPPALSPAVWRIGVLAAATLLILWALAIGVRALYRATSGEAEPPAETVETVAAEPEKPTAAPKAEAAKAPDPAAKPAEAEKAPRTPQKIPSLYLD